MPKYPNLKALMAKHNITQKALSELLDVSEQAISYKIKGTRDFTISEIEKIKEVFNTSYDEIFLPDKSA